ncbi:MAG TPA: multiheme c-type cytochrome [Candidatus Brocadiaceae bacterium]|nr:multiheme c-type cytochrome [Candidatus Brocadiaceae bacterium]
MKTYRIISPLFSLAAALLFAGCVCYPELVEKETKAPKSERCGECHQSIYKEWMQSPHANSYTNAAFREETNEYQFTFCLGCHAPETIFTGSQIETRGINLAEGVNCKACHLDDCKMSGPTPAHGPHPIDEKNPFYKTSGLCGKCHVGIFKAWQESNRIEDQKTCQECHMHEVERKLIQDDPWQKIYPKRMCRQHLFIVETMIITTENLLTMSINEVVSSDNRIKGVLEIVNAGIPHSVPAGDYGYREAGVVIQLQDKAGGVLDSQEMGLFVEMKTALQYKEKRDITFSFIQNKDAYSIKARLNRASLDKSINVSLIESTHILQ